MSCATSRTSTIRRAACSRPRRTAGDFRVINLYVPNGQAPGSEKFAYKLKWLEALTRWLKAEAASSIPGSWCSATSTSRPKIATCTIRRPGSGCVHVSPEERAALSAHHRARARGRLPAVRAAGEVVQLVGLPAGRIPPEQRPAHRPHPGAPATARRASPAAASTSSRGAPSVPPITRRWSRAFTL